MSESFGYEDEPFNPSKPKRRNRKEYLRKYYLEHKDHLDKLNKESYKRNRDNALVRGRERYYENREEILSKAKAWREKNPGYAAKGQRKYYQKNKQKYISRINTLSWVYGKVRGNYQFNKIEGPDKFCHDCKSINDLKIHHEIYPTRKKDIVDAIKNKKIYFLCKECHAKHHRKYNK